MLFNATVLQAQGYRATGPGDATDDVNHYHNNGCYNIFVISFISSIMFCFSVFLIFPFYTNVLPVLITGTNLHWRCMPLHMAAQIKMSTASHLSNSLALCSDQAHELQTGFSIWCSRHGVDKDIDTSSLLKSLCQ